MKYSIGSNLDNTSILHLSKLVKKFNLNKDDIEVYLSMPGIQLAMNRSLNKNITKTEFIQHVKLIQFLGFNVNYVFNKKVIDWEKDKQRISEELEMIKLLGINTFTIGNIHWLELLSPESYITLSVVFGLDTIQKIEDLISNSPDERIQRIILLPNINKSFPQLIEIHSFLKKKGIDIELIVTEPCSIVCTAREKHYEAIYNEKSFSCPYGIKVRNLLSDTSTFIHPEKTSYYEQLGVSYFKLATREDTPTMFLVTLEAFFGKNFEKYLKYYVY